MPTNKQAIIRYQALDRCFSNNGRRYAVEDLLQACNNALLAENPNSAGIQKRQLYADIRFMESAEGYGVELTKTRVGRKIYYHYSNSKFSINRQGLTTSEVIKLSSALDALVKFSGLPQFGWAKELLPMLEDKFGLRGTQRSVIGFENNLDLKGIDYLSPLFEAISNKRVLRVSYQPFGSNIPDEIIFHPFYLKQYNGRWFCFGRNDINGQEDWNLALDRIEGLQEIDHPYIPSSIEWEEYFYDFIGVTRMKDIPITEVGLRFYGNTTKYVVTKPLHPSQKHRWVKQDTLDIRIKVIPNFELENLLLSFGENVEVRSPKSLRDIISGRLAIALRRYFP